MAEAMAPASRSGNDHRGPPVFYDGANAASGCRDERRRRCHGLEHDVGQAIDVAAVVPDRRDADHVGRCEILTNTILRLVAQKSDPIRDANGLSPQVQLVAKVPSPAIASTAPGTSARASTRYLNPFLRTRRPAATQRGMPSPTPQIIPPRRPDGGIGMKACDVYTIRNGFNPLAIGAENHRAPRQIVAAGGDEAGATERATGRDLRRPEPLGDEHVGPVKADDERQRRCRDGRRDSAGDDPVAVHWWPDSGVRLVLPPATRLPAPAAPPRRRPREGSRPLTSLPHIRIRSATGQEHIDRSEIAPRSVPLASSPADATARRCALHARARQPSGRLAP